MKDWGTVQSTVCPEAMIIDDYSVWVNTGIQEETVAMEEETVTMYSYHMVQYSKNEYIQTMAEQNAELESGLTDTMELAIDHELRVTMLELGLTEN